jgi:DNA-binding winged helix-turn-helix (wHTH) protein
MAARIYQFERFLLDERERLLVCDGQVIPLRNKVFETLCVLVRNPGRLMHKDELMKSLWPNITVEENNLQHNLSVLRRVFRQRNNGRKFIETVSRHGYRFVAPVHAFDDTTGTLLEFGPPAGLPPVRHDENACDLQLTG